MLVTDNVLLLFLRMVLYLLAVTLPPTGLQPGTCFSDSDCNDASKLCSSDIPAQVCTCRAGQDSCNTMSTCQPSPAPPAPPVVVLTPCQKCQACVQAMQSVATSSNALTDRFAVGDVAYEACKQYWKDTPATNKELACSQLRKNIRESAGGITGKRAGLMCSLMSECGAAVAANSSCTITASNTTAGTLDLCTVEGVSSGAVVHGISDTTGAHMLSCGSVPYTKGSATAPPPCLCCIAVTCSISKVCADVHVMSFLLLCRPAVWQVRV